MYFPSDFLIQFSLSLYIYIFPVNGGPVASMHSTIAVLGREDDVHQIFHCQLRLTTDLPAVGLLQNHQNVTGWSNAPGPPGDRAAGSRAA